MPTLWGFTLVGMKYNGVTASDAAEYDKLVLVAEPSNPVDSKAVKVYGYNGTNTSNANQGYADRQPLGYISMNTQSGSDRRIPGDAVDGTVYEVYSSNTRGLSAVEIILVLDTCFPYCQGDSIV